MDHVGHKYDSAVSLQPLSMKLLRPSVSARLRGYIQFGVVSGQEKINERTLLIGDDLSFYIISIVQTRIDYLFDSSDAEVVECSKFNFFTHYFPMLIGRWRRSTLNYDGVVMIPKGPKNRVRTYRKLLNFIKRAGLAPTGQFFNNHPELIEGFATAKERPLIAENAEQPKIAVCLHLYYTELWGEVENLLLQWDFPFHLFLTLNSENVLLMNRVKEAFPNSTVSIVANKGRDVRPFLTILDQGLLSGFDLVCKIHGKRSSDNGRIGIFGDVVRRALFMDLVHPASQVGTVLQVFKDRPRVGIVGPSRLLVSARDEKKGDVFGQNRPMAEGLVERMGGAICTDDFDFFEGTMFWARPEALQPLRDLRLSADFFDDEAGKRNGAPEHALERLFNHSARIAGYEVGAVTATASDD